MALIIGAFALAERLGREQKPPEDTGQEVQYPEGSQPPPSGVDISGVKILTAAIPDEISIYSVVSSQPSFSEAEVVNFAKDLGFEETWVSKESTEGNDNYIFTKGEKFLTIDTFPPSLFFSTDSPLPNGKVPSEEQSVTAGGSLLSKIGLEDLTPLPGSYRLLAADSGGGRLRVVVANHFVRFALLPWSERVLGDKARRAVARALLQHNLGEAAARLDIALDRAAFGLNGLAAGIDRELLDGLRRIARERRLRLAAIQPQLTAELAAARRMLDDGCVVISEPGWLTLAGLRHGDLCLLRNHRAAATPAGQAGELLAMLAADFPAPMAATADPAVDRKILRIFTTDPWPENLGDWQVECHAPLAAGVGGA